jgi:hypothetical protein
MKKQLTILFLGISTSLMAQTQVPNNNFESWTLEKPAYNFYAPDNWQDGTACVSSGGPESCEFSIQRTTDKHSGTYALAHYTQDDGSGGADYQTFTDLDENFDGPAFDGRPLSMSFYYKYATNDNQPMEVSVTLYSGTILGSDFAIIGSGTYSISSPQTSYTKADVTITYSSTSTPAHVLIKSDYSHTPANGLDTLKLDDLTFNYSATATMGAANTETLKIYVANRVLKSSELVKQILLTDLTGKTAAYFDGEITEANLSQLKTGLYILTGTYNDQPFSRRLMIE